jgi:hypothetical protein
MASSMSRNVNPARGYCRSRAPHLVISIVHGTHTEAHVPLSRAANLFVLSSFLPDRWSASR